MSNVKYQILVICPMFYLECQMSDVRSQMSVVRWSDVRSLYVLYCSILFYYCSTAEKVDNIKNFIWRRYLFCAISPDFTNSALSGFCVGWQCSKQSAPDLSFQWVRQGGLQLLPAIYCRAVNMFTSHNMVECYNSCSVLVPHCIRCMCNV